MPPEPFVEFGRDICGGISTAERREWLVTNGIGGFASGTIAGVLTRRYHGLLVAALQPPRNRMLLVSKVDETAEYDGSTYELGTNRWAGGVIDPHGYRHVERFRLEGIIPVWTFACADALIEKRIWMAYGENTTYIRYDLIRGSVPLSLSIKVFINYRDYHALTHTEGWQMSARHVQNGACITPFFGADPFYLLSPSASLELRHDWHLNFDLMIERERGLEDREHHLHAATFSGVLGTERPITLVLSTMPAANLDSSVRLSERRQADESLIGAWAKVSPRPAAKSPPWVKQLVLAANAFIVELPPKENEEGGHSVIAGYPWFEDWGRDAMIALPGLTLMTGRRDLARSVLLTYSRFIRDGMLPNYFRAGGEPEYNTVDASLWFVEAIRQYDAAAHDRPFLREIFPAALEIINSYSRGTRFNIHTDPEDGLLYAGEAGSQITWMDARVDDRPVTPRIGKPVEVNALWFNALCAIASLARKLRKNPKSFEVLRDRIRASFQKFWNEQTQCCFDVIGGPHGNESAIRPNQILAVSLDQSPLTESQQRKVVDICARRLLTSYGLRTLDPADRQYAGRCAGPASDRDRAYHQGTVWGWLLGPFVLAHLRVYKDPNLALEFLRPYATHLKSYGLGTAGEIFDGDPPFVPRGCIAQAWTVAEILRAWTAVEGYAALK